MKNLKLIGFLILMVSSLMFIQCTSDPIMGPQGEAGIDGDNGTNGTDGDDGADTVASCVACHSDTHRDPIHAAYELSGHAINLYKGAPLTDYTNKSYFNGSCARCHSNEGYINYITGKPAVTIENPTRVSCTTCHSDHSTFDFENDGQDYALRNTEPVTLTLTDNYVIDYGNTSNGCVDCHQPRSMAPVDDGTGMYLQDDERFYPHYGGQSTMLEGIQGSFIAGGSTAMPGVGTAGHRTGSSCVKCHMGESADGQYGTHTFKASFSSTTCTACHGDSVPTEVTGLAADMSALHDALFALGLIAEDGSTIVQTELIPFKHAQAIWNYKTVEEDHSHGVHNPKYATALIKNALEAVQP